MFGGHDILSNEWNLFIILLLTLVLGVTFSQQSIISKALDHLEKPLSFLGKLSIYIYLNHWFFLRLISEHTKPADNAFLQFALIFGASTAFSLAEHAVISHFSRKRTDSTN